MRLNIQYISGELTPSLREWASRRVLFAVGQFGESIQAVHIRLSDVNGPKGGPDQRCLMEATLRGSRGVVAEVTDPDLYIAVSRAADRLGRRVRASLERAREHRRAPARRRGES